MSQLPFTFVQEPAPRGWRGFLIEFLFDFAACLLCGAVALGVVLCLAAVLL